MDFFFFNICNVKVWNIKFVFQSWDPIRILVGVTLILRHTTGVLTPGLAKTREFFVLIKLIELLIFFSLKALLLPLFITLCLCTYSGMSGVCHYTFAGMSVSMHLCRYDCLTALMGRCHFMGSFIMLVKYQVFLQWLFLFIFLFSYHPV